MTAKVAIKADVYRSRCRDRGISDEDAELAIARESNGFVFLPVRHPVVPLIIRGRSRDPSEIAESQQKSAPASGPGAELKKLLGRIGIRATPDCSCNMRAAVMNAAGCDWCEAHLDEIVGWLRAEAAKRGLPFLDAAGRMLVRRAIRNSRRAAG